MFFPQYKYKFLRRNKTAGKLIVLEVGIGNDSPIKFKKLFFNTEYHGLDKDLCYNLTRKSINFLEKFYQIDLEKDSLDIIPNNYYDYIIISHVIEHIYNGEKVIEQLSDKIKVGGYIYIEYPRKASKNFPSMKGTLNFYDDPTHKRFYNLANVESILGDKNFMIIKSGIKRDLSRVIGLPFMIIKSYITLRFVRGSVFWDILGFAEYILARRVK